LQDITERKRMEDALRGMNRKLIDAHEEERTRIARELTTISANDSDC